MNRIETATVKGQQRVGIERWKSNGIVEVLQLEGYGYEKMMAMGEQEGKEMSMESWGPYSLQMEIRGVDFDRKVLFMEELIEEKGSGRDWNKVTAIVLLFDGEESKRIWEEGDKKIKLNNNLFNLDRSDY